MPNDVLPLLLCFRFAAGIYSQDLPRLNSIRHRFLGGIFGGRRLRFLCRLLLSGGRPPANDAPRRCLWDVLQRSFRLFYRGLHDLRGNVRSYRFAYEFRQTLFHGIIHGQCRSIRDNSDFFCFLSRHSCSSLYYIFSDMMESLSVLTNSLRLAGGLFGRGARFGCSGFGVGVGFLRHSGTWADALQSRSFFAS